MADQTTSNRSRCTASTTSVELVDRGDPDDAVDEVLARLGAPLEAVMETQRAVRKVRPDPVDDRIVLRCIELALKAPTGSNGQNWEFVVVKDREIKAKLGTHATGRRGRCTAGSGKRVTAGDEAMAKVLGAVEWQVRALRGDPGAGRRLPARAPGCRCCRRRRSPPPATTARSTRACRTCCWRPGPWGSVRRSSRCPAVGHARPARPRPADLGDAGLRRPPRLAPRSLRPDDPPAGRRRRAPRPLRPAAVADMTTDRDWYELVAGGGPCPECGLDAGAVDRADLGPAAARRGPPVGGHPRRPPTTPPCAGGRNPTRGRPSSTPATSPACWRCSPARVRQVRLEASTRARVVGPRGRR